MNRTAGPSPTAYEPRWPTLAAVALLTLWIFLLSLPMWSGAWLAGPSSDQLNTGFAFRSWGAAEWLRTGSIPQWNPMIFGGLPFVVGTARRAARTVLKPVMIAFPVLSRWLKR